MWPLFSIFHPPYCHYAKVIFAKPMMTTACWRDPREWPEKHGGQTFSIKHHQQRNDILWSKQELVTTYQNPLQLHGQTMNLLHQDVKHGIVECGRCIRLRSILAVLQLRRHPPPCGDLWWLFDEWMSKGHHLGGLGGCIYAIGVAWGVLHLALHEILLGREANLVSIKSASSRFSWFATLPFQRHISYVRTTNNAKSVSTLCATKLSSTSVFIAFLRKEDKIPKQSQKIICLISDLFA
jgi:hypothetical protein